LAPLDVLQLIDTQKLQQLLMISHLAFRLITLGFVQNGSQEARDESDHLDPC
jgi:hypothetical protein